MNKYVIIVPAYNAADHLPELIKRIKNATLESSLLIVNDASTDSTEIVLKKLQHNYSFQFITNNANFGKGKSLQIGLNYANKQFSNISAFIFLDADLQHAPEKLPDFISLNEQGRANFIIGKRNFNLQEMPAARIISNYLTTLFLSIKLGHKIGDSQCGYRLIDAGLLQSMHFETSGYEFETEVLIKCSKLGAKFGFVPIPTIYANEKSYIKSISLIYRFLRVLFKY